MFHLTTRNEFADLVESISDIEVDWMPLGKLYKYVPAFANSPVCFDAGLVYCCRGKNSLHKNIVLDSIFTKEFLIEALNKIVESPGKLYRNYPVNVPHTLERIPFYIPSEKPDLLIACPKRELIISDDYPSWYKSHGRLS
jgi:hypothetical protein